MVTGFILLFCLQAMTIYSTLAKQSPKVESGTSEAEEERKRAEPASPSAWPQ